MFNFDQFQVHFKNNEFFDDLRAKVRKQYNGYMIHILFVASSSKGQGQNILFSCRASTCLYGCTRKFSTIFCRGCLRRSLWD
jgi:hypothetical protein